MKIKESLGETAGTVLSVTTSTANVVLHVVKGMEVETALDLQRTIDEGVIASSSSDVTQEQRVNLMRDLKSLRSL